MSGNEFQLVKIETHVLKVHIHCDGCARKVNKLLKRIEGVYLVSIDTEKQKVKVSGTVDCATLIRKLIKSGKHAELWSPTHTHNQNLQGLPSWLLDNKYQNLQQGQNNGVNAFKNRPIMASDYDWGVDDWSRERYLNQSGMNSLLGETNKFGATPVGINTHYGWNEDILPDEHNMEGNTMALAFPDSSNSAGVYTGFEDRGYPGLQQSLSSPAYEHYFTPLVMSNNMQQYQYNLPPKTTMLMKLQNLPATPAYDHYSPPLMMNNNMQQYRYNLPSPMKMNTDVPDMHSIYNRRMLNNGYMHQHPGVVNPITNSWNY